VQLERRCEFVVTDSGGSQEECYYLDRPCLVHRRKTERHEGLGETTVLSGLTIPALRAFLEDPYRHVRAAALPQASPSAVIVSHLEESGVVAGH
jgi:UDP-N-acetylglucosamine 2-epimerase (non-hydrolysing)